MQNVFRLIQIDDPDQGRILIARPLPKGNAPWGTLEPLRDTPWAQFVGTVSGEALSHALHGWGTALARELCAPPKGMLLKIARTMGDASLCAQKGKCIGFNRETCYPHPEVPLCFEAAVGDAESNIVGGALVLALKDGYHVVVVEGPEFSLT